MYGRDATHNGVVLKGAPPTDWQVGEFDRKSGAWHREKSRNVKWVANLGRVTFGDPVVAGGLVWVGTNNGHGQNIEDASVLACFRESMANCSIAIFRRASRAGSGTTGHFRRWLARR
jgi:hypothetical protein